MGLDGDTWDRVMDGKMAHSGKDASDHFEKGMQLEYQPPDSIMDGKMKFGGRDAQDHFGMGMGLFDNLDALSNEGFSSRPSGSSVRLRARRRLGTSQRCRRICHRTKKCNRGAAAFSSGFGDAGAQLEQP